MIGIKNLNEYEKVTDNGLKIKALENSQYRNYMREFQLLPIDIENENVVSTNNFKENFKSTLIQVIKNKYIC